MPPAHTVLHRLTAFYNAQFDARPTTTLTVANGLFGTAADVIVQSTNMVLEKDTRPKYDYWRTARFAVFGLGMGPVIGKWLQFLDKAIPMTPHHNLAATVKRVALDQIVMAPAGLVCFVGSMGIMEGKDKAQLEAKFRDVYKTALIANWKVWPAIQAINQGLVPLQYRLPFQQTCGILWNCYLSLLNAHEVPKKIDPKHSERAHIRT